MYLSFAVASAILFGSSDILAARATRHVDSVTVTRTALAVSALAAPLLLLIVDSTWTLRDTAIGAASGLAMGGGLLLLYRGYSVTRIGLVAPVSTVLLAAVPIVVDIARGLAPSSVARIGIALGLIAVVLTGYSPAATHAPDAERSQRTTGLVFAAGSGLMFGIAFTAMGEVSVDAGLSPVVAQRLVGFAVLGLLALWYRSPFIAVGSTALRLCVTAGVIATLAVGAVQYAFLDGASGPVTVAASQFGSVAVVLAVIVNHERLRWWQAVGVTLAAVAVALLAVGS